MARGRTGKNQKARRELVKPPSLTKAQGELWDRTVEAQSAAWLVPGMEPLLHAYVVSATYLQTLHTRREVAIADPDSTVSDITGWDDPIQAEARNLRGIMRDLRLTPQTRTHKEGAQDRPPLPWELHPEDDGDTA